MDEYFVVLQAKFFFADTALLYYLQALH
ncbi:MAG: hypothetical protein ACI9LE_001719, partial [Paraglaciecola sp.]